MESGSIKGRYFEDFTVGEEILTTGRTVSEAMVDAFAGVTGDFSYAHTDEVAMRSTEFGERIAHGLLSLCVLQGLMWQTGYTSQTGVATLGWETIRFPAPVRFGDTVHARFTIREMRPSRSRPELGILIEECALLNQRDEVVVTGNHVLMVRRRPAS
jgi:acyl dehydratase